MFTISFSLNKPKARISPIMMVIYYKKRWIYVSTKLSIPPEIWNHKKKEVKSNFEHGRQLNEYLANMRAKVNKWMFDELAKGAFPRKDDVKLFVNKLVNLDENEQVDFFDLYEKYIANGERVGDFKHSTVKLKKNVLARVKGFARYKNIKLSFDSINQEFYNDFVDYQTKVKNRSNPYVSKLIQELKTFMFYALKRKFHKNHEGIECLKNVGKPSDNEIALTKKEVNLIELTAFTPGSLRNCFDDFAESKLKQVQGRLERTRDRFLFQIYTGLRVSDLSNLQHSNFDMENNIIVLHDIKTENTVYIPIHQKLRRILKKYPNYLLPKISNQKYNKHVKDLCMVCGIDQQCQIVTYSGNKRIEKNLPKYQLVASHTARRTYVTMINELNINTSKGMITTGHKKAETFEKYNKMDKIKAAQEVGKMLDEM
jgi:integrase